MANRTIYVRPGDSVVVRVVANDEDLSRHGWEDGRSRPFEFSFVAERNGVTFWDPGLDVGFSAPLNPNLRTSYEPITINNTSAKP